MSFISYSFIGFLAVLFLLYYTLPKKAQWPLLLLGSYVFYALGDLRYLGFILVTTVSSFFAAKGISALYSKQKNYLALNKELDKEAKKAYKAKIKSRAFRILLACLLLNLGILFAIKYLNFTISNLNALFSLFGSFRLDSLNLLFPLGISFYTFQTMSYVIDVYFGKYEAEKNPFKLALFTSFFPQLLQGPIGRYNLMAPSLYAEHPFDKKTVSFGLERVLWGYFKKMVVADRIIVAVKTIIGAPQTYDGVMVVVGMLFYAAQLYCDFTGGIDITIGIGQMFGISMSENFDHPFFSKNIAEYWRRWHITMGTWFKDYTFYPLSTCKSMMRFTKFCKEKIGPKFAKRAPVYLATVILWFVTGIWHGASWNFIFWGLGNCVVILISQEMTPFYRKFHEKHPGIERDYRWRAVQILRTNAIMCCLRAFDCYASVGETFRQVFSIFTFRNMAMLGDGTLLKLGLSGADYILLGISILLVFAVSMYGRNGSVREKLTKLPVWVRVLLFSLLFVIILVFGAYGDGYDASGFIYDKF